MKPYRFSLYREACITLHRTAGLVGQLGSSRSVPLLSAPGPHSTQSAITTLALYTTILSPARSLSFPLPIRSLSLSLPTSRTLRPFTFHKGTGSLAPTCTCICAKRYAKPSVHQLPTLFLFYPPTTCNYVTYLNTANTYRL